MIIAIVAAVQLIQNNKHAKIDEWSSNLVADQIEWAEVAMGYSVEKRSYVISVDEYHELITILETVTEDVMII